MTTPLSPADQLGSALVLWGGAAVGQDERARRRRWNSPAVHDGLSGQPARCVLVFAPRPLYGFYAKTAPLAGLDPLADQQFAGVIMWNFGGMVHLGAALALAWNFLLPEGRAPLRSRA